VSRYAQNTTVAADASRNEIERTLTRYGADPDEKARVR
jgi:hypothetical protein